MGNRGPLPNLVKHDAERMPSLAPPSWLSTASADYWRSHAAYLSANDLLTTATADSFAILCDLWGRLFLMRDAPTTRAYLDTMKAFLATAKLFRLLPTEKPGQAPAGRHDHLGEFEEYE